MRKRGKAKQINKQRDFIAATICQRGDGGEAKQSDDVAIINLNYCICVCVWVCVCVCLGADRHRLTASQ